MRSKLLSPPSSNETHDAFMKRCRLDGGDTQTCEQLWEDAMGIAPQKGISLRPDPAAMFEVERRSWHRAITASVFACNQNTHAAAILKSVWPSDTRAATITRGASSPATTSSYVANDVIGAFKSLAPGSAAAQLFAVSNVLSMFGVSTIRIPYVASLPAITLFVSEGAPAPVQQFTLAASVLGPTKKMFLLAAVSGELEQAGPELASTVIGRVLADRCNKNLDTAVFSTSAGDAATPPGLLHSVTPISAVGVGSTDQMNQDLAAMIAAIGAAGIDPSDVVFVAGPREASLIRLRASPKFDNVVLPSLGLPAATVCAFAPRAIYSGYDGIPTIETARESVLHFESTTPTDISTAGTPPVAAAPAKSLFQSDLIAIKVRTHCAWCAMPGAAQVVSPVAW